MSSPILSVENLVKRYGGLTATDHFGMTVMAGEIHAVIGPNGAGKSTLIGQLAGELEPDEGRIVFDGLDITTSSVEQRARRGLARSYQITSVFRDFSALENVTLALQAHRGSSLRFWRDVRVEKQLTEPAARMLEQVGLGRRIHTRVSELAHGEQRQLELAMALVPEPRLLLLDEPMAGMGPRESEQMTAMLAALKGRYAILLVEHDMDAVFALADRLTVLVYGRALACGSVEEIRSNDEVRSAYLGDDTDSTKASAQSASVETGSFETDSSR